MNHVALLAAISIICCGHAGAATWNVNADGNWSDAANWSGGVPDGVGASASLTYDIFTGTGIGPKTVTLNTTSRTVGTLNIGDSGSAYLGYTLAASGGAGLILDNGLLSAQINKTGTTGAADTILAPLLLNSSLNISDNSGAGLLISGGVTANTLGLKTLTNKGTGAYAVELSGIIGDGLGEIGVTQTSVTSLPILSGANTYTGDTTVSAGTLQLGNGGTSGSLSLSSAIVNNASLVFNRSDILTQGIDFSSLISGTGGVTQAGSGTTILNGTNTFTGTTTLTAGVLSVSVDANLGNANALVFNGGTLQVTGTALTSFGSHATSITSNKSVGLDIEDAANIFTVSQVLSQGTGGLTKTGAGTLLLTNANTYSGLTTISVGTLAYGTTNALGSGAVTVNGGTLDIKTFNDTVGTVTLTNGSITGTSGVLTGTSYALNGTGDISAILAGSGTVTKSGAATIITLSGLNTFTGVTTLTGGTLSVSSIGNGGSASNLGAAAISAANLVFNGGTLQYTGATAATNRSFSIIAAKEAVIEVTSAASNLTISGAGGTATTGLLTKTGAGTLTLAGANTYTGVTTVAAGTLAYGVNNALSSGAVTVNGGSLDIAGFTDSVGALTLTSGSITGTTGVLTGTSYTLDGSGTISAILGGAGTLTKTNAGTATLSKANSYTGLTTVSGGTLAYGIDNALSSGAVTVNGGILDIAGYNDTVGAVILSAGTITGSTGTLTGTSYALTGTGTISAMLGGSGTLTKTNAGTVTLAGANTYTGLTTVSAGTLAYGIENALGSGAVTVSGGTLDISSFNDAVGVVTLTSGSITGSTGVLSGTSYALTGAGNISASLGGAGSLTKTGAATVTTLSGSNAYTGVTTLTSGTLAISSIDNLGAATTAAANLVFNGGTLQFTGASASTARDFTLTAATTGTIDVTTGALTISGASAATAGALTKTGAGTLTLGGANNHTGLTTVSAGTLAYGIENALGSGAVTVSGGTLDISSFNDAVGVVTLTSGSITGSTGVLSGASYALTGAGNISAILGGAGSLTKTGAATVTTLSGSNTYAGVTTLTGGTLAISSISQLGAATTAAANLVFNGGTLQFTGASASTDRNFTLTAATTGTIEVSTGTLTISGASAATTGALTKTGAGTLNLSGSNGHTGLTTVAEGTLAYGVTNALSNGAVTVTGGSMDISSFNDSVGAVTLASGSITGSTGVLIGASYALTGTGSISAILGGSATLTKSGTDTATLSGSNTYSGATSISAGTLKLGAAGTATNSPLGTIAAGTTVTSNATLDLNGFTLGTAEALTLNGIGADSLGALTNSSTKAATYSGLLTLGSSSRIGAPSGDIILSNTGTMSGTYDLRLEGSASGSSLASVIGIGSTTTLYKSGSGTWTLSGASTYSGITRIEAGTLKLGAAGNGSNSPLGTVGGATGTQIGGALDLNGFSLSTAEALTLRGSGVNSGGALTNSAATAATYKGALTMEAGVSIVASGGDIILSSATAVAGSAVQLTVGGAKNTTIESNYGPTSASTLTKEAAGTLTLTAVNTYAGATTITEGTLSVGTTGTINGTSGISIGAGTLNYNSTTALSKSVAFSGSGGTLSGTGKITPLVIVTAGNTLAPGNSIGTLSFGTGLTLAGTYAAQLGAPGTTPVTGLADLAAVTGALTLTNGTLSLSDNAGANSQGGAAVGAYRLLSFTGTRTGEFASVSNPLSASLHEKVIYTGTSNGTVDLNLYRLAETNTLATPVHLGVVRVGDTFGTSAVSIHNTAAADGFSEGLNASASSTSGGASSTGSVTSLAANATNNTSLLVGLGGNANTGTAGAKSGSVTVSLASTGSGTSGYGSTALSSQEITVSGGVYDFAQAKYSGTTLAFGNIHQGGVVSAQTLAIGNQTVSDSAYQDLLDVAASTDNAKVTASGFSALAASTDGTTTGNLSIGVDASNVGSLTSTASLTLTSNHNNVSGLSDGTATLVGTPDTITTTGQVYSGQMVWNGNSAAAWNGGANWTDSQDATVHAAPGLDAGFATVDSATFGNSSGNVTVNLDGAAPSVHALTFNNTGSYTIAQGTGTTGITLAGADASITVAGTHSITAPMTLANDTGIAITASGDSLTLSGEISGSGLTKTGDGTLALTGSNIYSGPTSVSGGTLLVNNLTGSGTGSGAVTIAGGANLGGSGTIGGSTTINGTHSTGTGIMSFTGGLAYTATSHLQWQLNDNITTGRGSIFGGVNVTGAAFSIASGAAIDLNFGSSVDFSNLFWNTNQAWTLVDLFDAVVGDGGFNSFSLGSTYVGAEGTFSVSRVADSDAKNDVVLTWTAAVTENPYQTWAKINITDKAAAADASPGGDPDNDGVTNINEFAFNGDPLNAADKGRIFALKADANDDGKLELVLTVAVRKSAVFAAGSATSPTAEGVSYAIEGSTNLTDFSATSVTPMETAFIDPGVALADSTNYEYRSFSLNGSSGLPDKGFLRTAVSAE
ncbi:MAG: autotransporter-associated beta strand repeat-containing protein [Verrucomicrobiota bacterium]